MIARRGGVILKKFCLAFLAFATVADAHGQTARSASSPMDLLSLTLPNVNREEMDRFLAASMMFSLPEQKKIVAYEMVTRCSIEIPTGPEGAVLGQPTLYSMGREYVSAVAPAIAMNTAIEIVAMLSGAIEPQQDRCTDRIRGYFGSQYEIDGADLRPLALRAIQILNGAPLDHGTNQIADLTARQATETARARLADQIKTPLFVGAVRVPGQVAVFVGEPGSVVRWVVQFRALDRNNFVVEGGTEAGLTNDIE